MSRRNDETREEYLARDREKSRAYYAAKRDGPGGAEFMARKAEQTRASHQKKLEALGLEYRRGQFGPPPRLTPEERIEHARAKARRTYQRKRDKYLVWNRAWRSRHPGYRSPSAPPPLYGPPKPPVYGPATPPIYGPPVPRTIRGRWHGPPVPREIANERARLAYWVGDHREPVLDDVARKYLRLRDELAALGIDRRGRGGPKKRVRHRRDTKHE